MRNYNTPLKINCFLYKSNEVKEQNKIPLGLIYTCYIVIISFFLSLTLDHLVFEELNSAVVVKLYFSHSLFLPVNIFKINNLKIILIHLAKDKKLLLHCQKYNIINITLKYFLISNQIIQYQNESNCTSQL